MGHTRKTVIGTLAIFIGIAALSIAVIVVGLNQEKNVVSNAEDAISIARAVFIEMYGEDELEEPLVAQYQWDGTWLVSGTPPEGMALGGVANAVISAKDGKIIEIWHEK